MAKVVVVVVVAAEVVVVVVVAVFQRPVQISLYESLVSDIELALGVLLHSVLGLDLVPTFLLPRAILVNIRTSELWAMAR
jgi:hypothetical protein